MQPFPVRNVSNRPTPPPLPRFWRSKFSYLIDAHGEHGAAQILQAMARAWERHAGGAR